MTTPAARRSRLVAYSLIACGAIVGVWLINHNSVNATRAFAKQLCENVAVSRTQGNERADVIRVFLLTAAKARARSARFEAAANPKQAAEDNQTALLYRRLASRVKHTVPPTC